MNKVPLINLCALTILFAFQSCKKDATFSKPPSEISSTQSADDATITDSSLLCYLPFNGNLKDKSGHNNNGALVGNVSYVPDRFGSVSRAASFAASNTFIEIPEAQFVGLTNMTISMDFYATSPGRQLLLSKISYNKPFDSPEFNSSLVLVIEQNNFYPIQFNTKKEGFCNSPYDWDWNTTVNSNTNFILNQWNHVAVTFNNSVQRMYLNGILVGIGTKVPSPVCQGEPIRLGVWWSGDPLYFTGNMDEVRIYNRVLSQKEIRKLAAK